MTTLFCLNRILHLLAIVMGKSLTFTSIKVSVSPEQLLYCDDYYFNSCSIQGTGDANVEALFMLWNLSCDP